jgi:hypothetical protein
MSDLGDWRWKLQEAAERVRTRYDHIGRKTGAPFLAIVYPPEAERTVLREWHTLAATLRPEYDVECVNALDVTTTVVRQFGVDALVGAMQDPMPGSDPTAELGSMWTTAIVESVRKAASKSRTGRLVVAVERLAALYPASGPRMVMQSLWDSNHSALVGPVVLLVPGIIVEARVYSFVGRVEEFMYRGDIL